MVYADPKTQSPLPSPTPKETSAWRKAHSAPTHIEDITVNMASSPLPTMPRRASSSNSSTPRKGLPSLSRQSSANSSPSKPLEGIPRRASYNSPRPSISGLPSESGSLGLKLHGSPTPGRTSPPKSNGESSVPTISFDPNFTPSPRSSPARSPLSPPAASSRPMARRNSSGHVRGSASASIPFPSSASTSELPAPPIASPSWRPSTIRKKSGELVKPSLKLRSMSTPDLTRQAEPESPSPHAFGEERSKSVRFADSSEGDSSALENVVLFLREQKVTAVGKAIDPDAHMTETETEGETDASDFVQFRTRKNAAAKAADEANQIQLDGASRIPRKRTDFSPDARGSLTGENVILERIELQTANGLSLRGSVIVRNLAFSKWVAVRFTMDHWQTVSEVSGTHVCHIPSGTTGDEGWDRFSFAIRLEDYKRKIDERQLIMCVHYSVEGKDWWDSNNGINYNFTFKKSASRRASRTSGPAALGGSFMRLNEPSTSLPGLRKNTATQPSLGIKKVFGSRPPSGPNDWVFPKLSQRVQEPSTRPDSPLQSPPPKAYKAPAPPTVHTHLSLSKYCAPSPPLSPPTETFPSHSAVVQEVSRRGSMGVMGGGYATLEPPVHERRSSWNGQESSKTYEEPRESANKALAAMQSPAVEMQTESPASPHKPLSAKRSVGDLRSLVQEAESDNGLMTPPSSNLSSPPTPRSDLPPELTSSSTGDSSSMNTSTESTPDVASMAIDIGPEAEPSHPKDHKVFSTGSYQEFLDKFCFFQSPRATPSELAPSNRPSYIPLSGNQSPNGFPFFHPNASQSPRTTPTPTAHYATAQEAFGFRPVSQDSTPTKRDDLSPMAHPQPVDATLLTGYHANPADTMAWAQIYGNNTSPSLAAAI
ncbi:hypothetical protein, variant 3 [Cryptococcus amylolentus CBS 6039]|uniref:CBM21 domain-containing protein n=2 Tax=Cryptococcus amylolentus TaxID=104669 RepID=A0A1E3HQC9_9TREE|nr:hypothetical protein, variant 1 [Cryptococcus amylolentus CBS 6039]XP_018993582.1 hypothetical protein, variant 2 [Cryptococcus amylolentus CBS 6039]XP_018993583.1 hypothetical protein, variant 3 [Cryptococcus amylolentus CBS 6039]ODO06898.1 hypothetical protein I350_04258 [Cryptococcus amylolentus CBS 6273]ODN78535.1 hypothetical protein, variant 1 [Cryptococcus amylolentus CBS 6039]ODN78536.1 hypothetical protein, variant 2 [Cryptococcus amylolentus CBS 6039]ODN78537.1 hypothetical prote